MLRSSHKLLLTLFCALALAGQSQTRSKKTDNDSLFQKDCYLEMKGTVKEMKGAEKEEEKLLDSVLVTISQNGIPYTELWTNKKGRCSFKLACDKTFHIEVSKPGYVTKFFEVNTKVAHDKRRAYSFVFDIDIFEEVKGLDVAVLQKPIAKVSYNHLEEQFAYDVTYTSRINFELRKMYKNYYMLQKIEADSVRIEEQKNLPAGNKK
jgi:hypothetical protein